MRKLKIKRTVDINAGSKHCAWCHFLRSDRVSECKFFRKKLAQEGLDPCRLPECIAAESEANNETQT